MKKKLVSPFGLACISAALITLAAVSSCKQVPVAKKTRREVFKAVKTAEKNSRLLPGPLTLEKSVRIALANNLKARAREQEIKIKKMMEDSAFWKLLPELNASWSWSHRSNPEATYSTVERIQQNGVWMDSTREFNEAQQTSVSRKVYSRSEDQTKRNWNIGLAVSVLDWGVSYYNLKKAELSQAKAAYSLKKFQHRLATDVIKAGIELALAQKGTALVEKAVKKEKQAVRATRDLMDKGYVTYEEFSRREEGLERVEEMLSDTKKRHSEAMARFAKLLGVPPGRKIKVDTDTFFSKPDKIPDLEELLETAVISRPDIYEKNIDTEKLRHDTKIAFLKMFPSVDFSVKRERTSNSFELNPEFTTTMVNLAKKITDIPGSWKNYKASGLEAEKAENEFMDLVLAVMAQVTASYADYISKKELLDKADQKYRRQEKLYELEKKRFDLNQVTELSVIGVEKNYRMAGFQLLSRRADWLMSYYELVNASMFKNLLPEKAKKQVSLK